MKKIAILLSGCGVYDGAEIHEATMSMYAVVKLGATYTIFAPNIMQHHVINHITGKEMNEERNVLIESARIARGKISDLSEFNPSGFDALLLPGGFGVAKNLSDFAFKGSNAVIDPYVEKAVKEMHALKKPIGALCIAPAIIACILKNVNVTIGNDQETINQIIKTGATHQIADHAQVIHDKINHIFTTPCYMLNADIVQIADGAFAIVEQLIKHCK